MEALCAKHDSKTLTFDEIQKFIDGLLIPETKQTGNLLAFKTTTPEDIRKQASKKAFQNNIDRKSYIDHVMNDKIEQINLKRRSKIHDATQAKLNYVNKYEKKTTYDAYKEANVIYDQALEMIEKEAEILQTDIENELILQYEKSDDLYNAEIQASQAQYKILFDMYQSAKKNYKQ